MAFNKFDFFNSSIIPLSLDTSHFKWKIERNLNLKSVENLYFYSTMEIAASISSTPFPEQTSAVSCKRYGVGVWVVSDWGCCDVCFRTDGVGGRSGWWGINDLN